MGIVLEKLLESQTQKQKLNTRQNQNPCIFNFANSTVICFPPGNMKLESTIKGVLVKFEEAVERELLLKDFGKIEKLHLSS